ncbi:CGNR zinc finger domain-containing protein [Streptomyces luteolus]|uniref:ABATE domain-containing protein n=1 Tax=Streptomyces luteolus TaxID=3043615 RepID=A0ABT6SQ85_9ACTN|nr:ABATE domain-containing protein [Streptomyces sp. B-S-A12]MDI3417772.1 ABATE domain-containing protein [Streptomyces sp. B-S-A12]
MRFAFVSGSPALDLIGTVGSRRDTPVDLLAGPADLRQWVLECGELPDDVRVDEPSFTSALRLREALYELALDRLRARAFSRASLDVVNEAAAAPPPVAELTDAGLTWSGDIRAVLAHVARSGIALLADRDACLKECGRTGCTRLYVDRSRGARRTWCGMDACGNRVKAAAYRARKRGSSEL